MSIGGISLSTVVIVLVLLYVGMRWGNRLFGMVGLA